VTTHHVYFLNINTWYGLVTEAVIHTARITQQPTSYNKEHKKYVGVAIGKTVGKTKGKPKGKTKGKSIGKTVGKTVGKGIGKYRPTKSCYFCDKEFPQATFARDLVIIGVNRKHVVHSLRRTHRGLDARKSRRSRSITARCQNVGPRSTETHQKSGGYWTNTRCNTGGVLICHERKEQKTPTTWASGQVKKKKT